jgi:hypothetical protein
MSEFLNLDAILAAPDVTESDVDVPEWGGKVKVKALSKADQIRVRKDATDNKGNVDDVRMEGGLLVAGVVEPALETKHIPDLFAKSASAVDKVLQAILGVSGMTEDDKTAVTKAEDAFKS